MSHPRFARVVCVGLIAVLCVACERAEEPQPPNAEVAAVEQQSEPRISPQEIAALFAQVSGDVPASTTASLPDSSAFSQSDPNWPTLTYLVGEIELQRGDFNAARSAFREVVSWAAALQSAPGNDSWGGSALAPLALWRWLEILDEHGGEPRELDLLLDAAATLRTTRLFGGMVGSGLLPALPLLEEDIARRLTHVASKAERPEAKMLLLYYVSINSTGTLEPVDEAIVEKMIEQGSATRERLDLFRYQRLLNRVTLYSRKKEAAEKLGELWRDASAPTDVRAEAAYEWGNFYRRSRSRKPQVIEALSEAYDLAGGKGTVAEKALYRRGMVLGSVAPEEIPVFYADMEQLIVRHPRSRLADDALYQIAMEELFGLDAKPDRAFETFAKLRSFSGSNDWLDSSYFLPAIGYFDRGTAADLQAADRLLGEYIERYPDGVFRQRSLFWRARIAERTQDTAAAKVLFQQVIDETPYDYYGLRSRMHREFGADAAQMALPQPSSLTFAEIGAEYRDSTVDVELEGHTPYHDRIRTADESGVYVRTLGIVDSVGPTFRNRVDNIPLADLDENRLIPAIALLLSLRQDVLAARDADPAAENQLRLAGFAGHRLGDWPTAMLTITNQAASERTDFQMQLQADRRYLATSYPGIADMPVLRDSLAESAWAIDDSIALAQSLMYAVIRRESGYFPGAISPVGAIGLFQIMPATFENRQDCWDWPGENEPTPAAYLFNSARNVQFWSCWIQKEFAPTTRADLAPLIMAHNAGAGNLKEWRMAWQGRAIEGDLELQIESVRFRATQTFLRRVLTDTAIAESSGQFGAETPSQEPTP